MFNLSMIMNPTVKAFIANTLTEEQQIWLSKDLVNRPLGVPEFFLSKEGQDAIQVFMKTYMKYADPNYKPALVKPKKTYRKNLETGEYEEI